MSSEGSADQGSRSPKSASAANGETEKRGSFSIFKRKRAENKPPPEKGPTSPKSFLDVFRPRSSRSPSPISSPSTSTKPLGPALPAPPGRTLGPDTEEKETVPTLEPVTIDASVLEQLRKWQNDHPERRLTQVLERVAQALEFKPFLSALDAIPSQPFPVGPLLKSLAGLIAFAIKIPRRKRDAYDFAMQVVEDLSKMADAFGVGDPEDKLYHECKQDLEPFCKRTNDICLWAVQQLGSSLAFSAEEERLDFQQKIADAKLFFLTLTTIRIIRELSGIGQGVTKLLEYNERLGGLKNLRGRFRGRLAKQFQYTQQDKDECHKATRSQVLAEINKWMQPSLSERKSQGMWVVGNAGVGKSSIAITVVKCLLDQRPLASDEDDDNADTVESEKKENDVVSEENQPSLIPGEAQSIQPAEHNPPVLLAQYFCNHLLDSADMNCLFPTLAIQLAENSPAAAHLITNAIASKPSIVDKFSERQAKLIFVEPLRRLAAALAPKVIAVMIDGVDEFRAGHTTRVGTFPHRHITRVLASVAESLPNNVRLLILSRPQEEILAALPPSPSRAGYKLSIPDVRKYFEDELPKIRFHHPTFPTTQQVDDLVTYSDGHLGWAKQSRNWLAIRLQTMSNDVDLDQELRELGKTVHGDLYSLYQFLLDYLLRSHGLDQPRYLLSLQRVLHTLVGLTEPQSIDTISRLNNHGDGIEVRNCLKHLSGLYAHDSSQVDDLTVPQPHKSFYDFLVSADTPSTFRVDGELAHAELARGCWTVIFSDDLHFNMGHFHTNYQFSGDRDDAKFRIPELLRYACSSVIHHLVRSGQSFAAEVVEWMSKKFLFWLEVVYMSGIPSDSHHARMRELEGMQITSSKECSVLLRHAIDFITTFFDALSYGPLFLYIVAIPFCPSAIQSSVAPYRVITTVSRQDGFIKAGHRLCTLSPDGRYAALLSGDTLFVISPFDPTGHRFEANVPDCGGAALSFSHDVATLFLATLVTGKIHLNAFDVFLGTKEGPRIFEPTIDENCPTKLAGFQVSSDGACILISVELESVEEAGEDEYPETWVFVYHNDQLLWNMKVSAGSCSRFLDDDKIILQLDDNKVHLIDSLTGSSNAVLMEQENNVTAIALSTTSIVVAASSSLTVSNDRRNETLTTEPPSDFDFITARFSGDGKFFALGTDNGGLQIWSSIPSEWNCVATFFAHFGSVQGLAFHPNGKHLVAVFANGTVGIWDISAIVEGRKWEVKVEEGVLADGGWFSHCVPLGGWLWGGTRPEPFLFQYPFELPQGVAVLDWKIHPRVSGDAVGEQGTEKIDGEGDIIGADAHASD